MKQDQIYKRKDVLIKCITSWQVWSIFFSLREDWFLFMAWTLLEVNCPQSKAELRGLVTLFLLTTNLFLAHPYSFSAPTKKPMIFYFLYFHQRPFSFSDFWFFSSKPSETSENSTWLIIFSDTNFTFRISSCFKGKKWPQGWS